MASIRGRVAALVVASALAACTNAPPVASPSPTPTPPSSASTATTPGPEAGAGGTLRYALGGNPGSIDPRFLADAEGTTVVDALFDSLVAIDPEGQPVPAAAAAWDVSADGLRYTFSLRPEATYHDGSPVEAEDFVRAFRRIVDREGSPPSFLHYQLAPVEGYRAALDAGVPLSGVRALDATTLEIQLSRVSAEFLLVLAHPSLAPIPDVADEDPDGFAETPVGNGPFAMAEAWQPNQFIRVTRFAAHHTPARLDEVVFQIFADDPSRQQQYDDFERGQVDVAEVPPASLSEAATTHGRSRDGVTGPGVLQGLTGALYAYGFNTELPPFDDPAARRAVSMLIDRERIVDQILLDARVAADTLVPPSLPGAEAGRCGHCRFDPEGARAELGLAPDGTASPSPGGSEPEPDDRGSTPGPDEQGSAAGGATTPPPSPSPEPTAAAPGPTAPASEGSPSPETAAPGLPGPIEIVVNAGSTNERIAARIAADIEAALGIDVTTRTAEPAAFVGEVRAGEVQVFRLGWEADHLSPGAVLQPLFRSDGIDEDNLTRFRDAEVDALLDQARATEDQDARNDLYGQAEERILALAPVAPIFFYRQNRVVAETVRDLRIGPLGAVTLSEAWKVEPA